MTDETPDATTDDETPRDQAPPPAEAPPAAPSRRGNSSPKRTLGVGATCCGHLADCPVNCTPQE